MLKLKNGFYGERSIVLPEVVREQQKYDPLLSSLYVTDIGYYPHAQHHYRERTEPIGEHVLIYCVNGKGYCRIDDKEYPVRNNQYFILPAGSTHAYWSDESEPWTIYWVHFSGEHSFYYIEDCSTPKDIRPGLTSRISNRNSIFEEIFLTLSCGYTQEELRYVSSLLHYYLGSMRFLHQYRSSTVEGNIDSSTFLNATIHYFRENIEQSLNLATIANYLGYSVSHFSAMFKKQTGVSPIAYFNNMKIQRAKELLDTSNMNISQISFKVGIEDPYYLSRLFRKVMGVSPKAYRERCRKKEQNEE